MIALLALACASDPHPIAVSYDHVACAHCAMLVSDPRFAAQLETRDGDHFVFDDPSCLFRYVLDNRPSMANAWFRDSTADTDVWLPSGSVGFVPSAGAPMDGGLAAVPVGTAGAMSFGEASSRVLGGGR